jgi:Ala-tRNA(Pro) deacylase
MSIAPTLQRYLASNHIQYDVVAHEPTTSSTRTAEACHISGNCFAKAVVLRRDGGYMLAVLPASRHLHLTDLRDQLGDNVQMAKESEIDRLFPDCAHGAIPAVGQCYGLSLLVDDSIEAAPDVYMEAGRPRDADPHEPFAVCGPDGAGPARPFQRADADRKRFGDVGVMRLRSSSCRRRLSFAAHCCDCLRAGTMHSSRTARGTQQNAAPMTIVSMS